MKRKPDPNNPSSTFFWKDYENDAGLRVSSLAAQGLWMRLLCVAAKSDPYGYVLINGCEIGVTGVARLGSVSETEAATLLDELERNGVFSRDRKGRIYSRRMVKESAARKKATENGKKGGNPALSTSDRKQKEKSDPVNLEDKAPDKPPYPYPSSSLRSEDDDSALLGAHVRENSLLRERILAALGADPQSGLTGPNGRMIGTVADMERVRRWQVALSDDEIVQVATEKAASASGLISSFKYLDGPMSDLIKAKAAPPMPVPDPFAAPSPSIQPSATGGRHANIRTPSAQSRERVGNIVATALSNRKRGHGDDQ